MKNQIEGKLNSRFCPAATPKKSDSGRMRGMSNRAAAVLAAALLLAASAWADSNGPLINGVVVDGARGTISIQGSNLLGRDTALTPQILLNGAQLTVSSSSATQVVAALPRSIAPGTYLMSLIPRQKGGNDENDNNNAVFFDVAIGAIGPQGPSGAQGPQGLNGPQGPQGPQGAAGPQGPAGANGAVGPIGPAGANGAVGPVGPAGANGAVGPVGSAGANGAVGPIGPAGANGAVGPVGSAGANGAVGPIGPAGANGANGAVGPVGPAGGNGATGAVGPAGANGSQGPAGTNGSNGVNGAPGTPGIAGPQGPAGPPTLQIGMNDRGFLSATSPNINGTGKEAIHVAPGGTVSISFDWANNRNGYCPSCNEQVLGGLVKIDTTVIPGSISSGSCFYVGDLSGGTQTFTFTAPTTVGTYYIGLYTDLYSSCPGALNAPRTTLGLDTFIAAVTVY